jgi:hypothetical protein
MNAPADATTYKWELWSDVVSMSGEPDFFVGTDAEAMKYFTELHAAKIAEGCTVEDYSDEVHLYAADADWEDDELEPIAGMTCEGEPDDAFQAEAYAMFKEDQRT